MAVKYWLVRRVGNGATPPQPVTQLTVAILVQWTMPNALETYLRTPLLWLTHARKGMSSVEVALSCAQVAATGMTRCQLVTSSPLKFRQHLCRQVSYRQFVLWSTCNFKVLTIALINACLEVCYGNHKINTHWHRNHVGQGARDPLNIRSRGPEPPKNQHWCIVLGKQFLKKLHFKLGMHL